MIKFETTPQIQDTIKEVAKHSDYARKAAALIKLIDYEVIPTAKPAIRLMAFQTNVNNPKCLTTNEVNEFLYKSSICNDKEKLYRSPNNIYPTLGVELEIYNDIDFNLVQLREYLLRCDINIDGRKGSEYYEINPKFSYSPDVTAMIVWHSLKLLGIEKTKNKNISYRAKNREQKRIINYSNNVLKDTSLHLNLSIPHEISKIIYKNEHHYTEKILPIMVDLFTLAFSSSDRLTHRSSKTFRYDKRAELSDKIDNFKKFNKSVYCKRLEIRTLEFLDLPIFYRQIKHIQRIVGASYSYIRLENNLSPTLLDKNYSAIFSNFYNESHELLMKYQKYGYELNLADTNRKKAIELLEKTDLGRQAYNIIKNYSIDIMKIQNNAYTIYDCM